MPTMTADQEALRRAAARKLPPDVPETFAFRLPKPGSWIILVALAHLVL